MINNDCSENGVLICEKCGRHISSFFQIDDCIFCSECAEKMDIDDILSLFSLCTISQFFIEIGIPYSGFSNSDEEII